MLPRRAEWLPNLPQLSGEALVPRIEASLAAIVCEELERRRGECAAGGFHRAGLRGGARRGIAHLGSRLPKRSTCARWRDHVRALPADRATWRAGARCATGADGDRRTPRKRFNKDARLAGRRSGCASPCASHLPNGWRDSTPGRSPRSDHRRAAGPAHSRRMRAARSTRSADCCCMAAAQLTRIFDEQGECDHTEIAGAARQALTEDSARPRWPSASARASGTSSSMNSRTPRASNTSCCGRSRRTGREGDGRTLVPGRRPDAIHLRIPQRRGGALRHRARRRPRRRCALEALELRRNFRSAPALVHWCNDVFARVFPARRRPAPQRGAPPGERRGARRPRRRAAAVPSRCRLRPRGEAEAVAESIAELRATRPERASRCSRARGAPARDSRGAGGARHSVHRREARTTGRRLRGARSRSAGARARLAARPRCLARGAARPFIGLTLPDLTADRARRARCTIPAALRETFRDCRRTAWSACMRAAPILLAAWQEREREPRAHLVERVWLALGGPSACAQPERTRARAPLPARRSTRRTASVCVDGRSISNASCPAVCPGSGAAGRGVSS